jgi:hypothetical protein
VVLVGAGMMAGMYIPRPEHQTLYGLRVQRVVGKDSLNVISPPTGPLRADFCPDFKLSQYEPRVGYVLCKLSFVNRGCWDVLPSDQMIWVKDKDGWTATLTDNDTFQPYPKCTKDEPLSQGGNDGPQ